MYNKFSKGESIKTAIINTGIVDSSFPAKDFMEMWSNNESKRYEVLERPIRNLFQNDLEDRAFAQMLLKGLKIGKEYDETTNKNSILYGCELSVKTIGSINYASVSPGLFTYNDDVYEIYPSCYKASRQLEKSANLDTENGLEYINIIYEGGKFKAEIKLFENELYETPSPFFDRGIDLIDSIITYMVDKKRHKTLPATIIGLSDFAAKENYQLEPVFVSNATLKYVSFNGTELISETSLSSGNLSFGTMVNATINTTAIVKWDGFTTSILKDDSITNDKLNNMPSNTIKGNDDMTSDNPDDLNKERVVAMFDLVTKTNETQSIEGIKTFTNEVRVSNDKKLVFKKSSVDTGWSIKSTNGNALTLTQDSTPITPIISIANTTGISTISKAVNITDVTDSNNNTSGALIVKGGVGIGESLNVGGNTIISGTTKSTGSFTVGASNFTVDASNGNTIISGTTKSTGSFTVGTDKFTVDASNGNTTVIGTLDITGKTKISSNITSTDKDTGALVIEGGLGVEENVNIGGATKSTGNLTVGENKLVITASNGNTAIAGNLSVNTDKFTVDASNGNTIISGTTKSTGSFTVGTDKFTVDASNGNTTTKGAITIDNITESSSVSTGALIVKGGVGIANDLWVGGDIKVTGVIVNGDDFQVNGGDITTDDDSFRLLNEPTSVDAFTSASTLNIGASTGTASINNTTIKFPNATTLLMGETNGAANITLTSDKTGTLNLFNSNLSTVDAFSGINTVNLGVKASASTFNISTGAIATGIKNVNIGTGGAAGSTTNITIGSTAGTSKVILNKDVSINNDLEIKGDAITTTQTTSVFSLLNTSATKIDAFGAATTLNIGATSGTATIKNSTIELPNATTLLIGKIAGSENITLSSNKTGKLTLFNSGLLELNAFGAVNNATILGTTVGSTINLASGAIVAGVERIINIGTGGAASSINNITIGSSAGISNIFLNNNVEINNSLKVKGATISTVETVGGFNLLNDTITKVNAFGAVATLNIGDTITTNQTINIGTKVGTSAKQTINIGNANSNTSVININHITPSTNISTGSVVVSGGVGIKKGLYIGETLNVSGNSTLSGTLDVSSNFKVNSDRFTITALSGNVTTKGTLSVDGTSTLSGLITNTEGFETTGNIKTTVNGYIQSNKSITAGTNITSTAGSLNIDKRDFLLNLGNNSGTYDWSISKAEASSVGSLLIKNTATSPITVSISDAGLITAPKFTTSTADELNSLNVNKHNGHTIVNTNSSSSSGVSSTSLVLWEDENGSVIKRTAFSSLPAATYTGNDVGGNPEGINGLMTPLNLRRISNLEEMAGWSEGGGTKKLVGTVNGEEADSSGGNVLLDTTHIHMSGSTGETVSTRLSSNAAELTRLKGHVPTGTVTSGTDEVMLKNGTTVSWGKITDKQLSSTITNVSPKDTTGTSKKNWMPLAFWNSSGDGLLRDHDVVYSQTDDTLTATNVTSRSSRTVKKDIETYNESAFDILDQIEVVSFHYIADETQADKVGFIAEDSPELVAGLNHDKMEIGNCIGLLIKAVQELKKENEDLRRLLNGN